MSLPDKAFIVEVDAMPLPEPVNPPATTPQALLLRGRIEHVATGRSAPFAGLEALASFVSSCLAPLPSAFEAGTRAEHDPRHASAGRSDSEDRDK